MKRDDMQGDRLDDLVAGVYEAPLGALGWNRLVPALEERLNGRVALFVQRPHAVATVASCTAADAAMVANYEDRLWLEDRAMRELRSAPAGEIILDTNLISNRERASSAFYGDYLGSRGLDRGLYLSAARHRDETLVLSVQRNGASGDYSRDEIALIRTLAPHLGRSFRTWQQLRDLQLERDAALTAVACHETAVALVDHNARLRFANAPARTALVRGPIRLVDHRVVARSPSDTKALHAAIATALCPEADDDGQSITMASGSECRTVLVKPLWTEAMRGSRAADAAMLMIASRPPRRSESEAARAALGLTPAETRLLKALVAGERLEEYAVRTKIAASTVKSHLRALFDKTGERRQADLIRRAVLNCWCLTE